jgi:hypothetical protein
MWVDPDFLSEYGEKAEAKRAALSKVIKRMHVHHGTHHFCQIGVLVVWPIGVMD